MKRISLFVIHSFFLLLVAGLLSPPATAGPAAHGPGANETLQNCCERIMNARRSIFYLNDWRYRMAFQLRSIYTRDEAMFFCLGLCNHSHIDYAIDSIRFYIADEKRGSKPAKGAVMIPLCVSGNTRVIRGRTREYCVFALPRFTLPDKKILVIDVSEKNGGRHLQLLANNFTLVRARLI
jgi:hypothetical protein